MNSENNHHNEKTTRRKWPWIILLCIVAFLGLARLALMTGAVQEWVRNTVINTANNQLIPTLSIENISGDLWNRATLTNIVLTDRENTVLASIDTLHLAYSPLSYFSDAFRIQEVRLNRPFVKLKQQPDSTWNVQNWMRPSGASPDTTSDPFSFLLNRLVIESGAMDVSMSPLQEDSSFVIEDMNLSGGISYFGDRYEASVGAFNARIVHTRLDAPVTIETAAEVSETVVTLEKLAVATGQSVLNASGQAHLGDSTASVRAETSPLGWKDLASYMEDMPVRQDVRLSLGIEGTPSHVDIQLTAGAEGIEQFRLAGRLERGAAMELTSLELSASQLDLETFTGDTTMPSLQDLSFKAAGSLPLDRYQEGRLRGRLSAANIRQGVYGVDLLQGSFTWENEAARIRLKPAVGREELTLGAEVSQLWDDQPFVRITVNGSGINPANWLQEEAYAGNMSFEGEASGPGWYPGEQTWDYQLSVDKSRLMGRRLDYAEFGGRFSQQMVTNQSRVSLEESQLVLEAEARQLQAKPVFSYTVNGSDINLADFAGLEDYPSSISFSIEGAGRGNMLQNLDMQNSVRIDSSIFLGETIRNFSVDTRIQNAVMTVQNGVLESNFAEGNFNGRMHLEKAYDTDNSLSLGIRLKDLSSFASVADVEVLQATGNINGKLTTNGRDMVVFEGGIDLDDVNYNNQFTAPEISGGIRFDLSDNPEYMADFEIVRPSVASVALKNIRLKTEGQRTASAINGSYVFEVADAHDDRISQAGGYRASGDSISIEMTEFDLTTPARTLSLQQPFNITWSGNTLSTDTLRISNKDGTAFMELAVPLADSLHQKGYLRAEELNLKAIQNAMLDSVYLEGMLFGELQVDRTDTSLAASGDLLMSNIQYGKTELDSMLLQAVIEKDRLEGLMELRQDGDIIAEGDLNIPFKAGDPELLDSSFFEQPVSGKLAIHAVKLDRFSALLKEAGYENTEGILQFEGRLEGKAGQPELDAALNLRNVLLSGVPVDSLVASVDYEHSQSSLNLNAVLTSLKQKALYANARMPLDIDLRTWEVRLPEPRDSISVAVQTNQFNLKALNDFLDRNMMRNLQGRISGQVEIEGPRNNLQASGEISLQKGAVRLVPVNIRLVNIRSTLQFKPGEIVLTGLNMESGGGNLSAKGAMTLNKLVPGDIDFTANAENFKVANTDEYNGMINMNVDLGGSASKPVLSGNLDVINGFIELDNFGEKSVEEVRLDTTMTPKPEISLYDSLALEMNIGFNRRFFVRNERYLEMELELDGEIDLLKDPDSELQMFGTLKAANGYAEPLGKRFELENGSLSFSGPVDNPQINVRTLYEPPQTNQEIKIWYVIEGTVENPRFKYESSPEMDLAGIISYTLFGQPYYKLDPTEQSVARNSSSNAAADFAVEVLMDRVESLATQHLGIDVVRIENTRVGGESGTSISTGWYINPKVFFAIQNVITGSTPTTGFYLEYYLRENLRLILSQSNDNRQGIDVQWKHDY